MSVRMALAKLSACAAGWALVGGGAVHVAETPAEKGEYRKVKMVKTEKPVKRVVQRAEPEPRPVPLPPFKTDSAAIWELEPECRRSDSNIE